MTTGKQARSGGLKKHADSGPWCDLLGASDIQAPPFFEVAWGMSSEPSLGGAVAFRGPPPCSPCFGSPARGQDRSTALQQRLSPDFRGSRGRSWPAHVGG